jgi:B9 domain-containing protein 1
VVFNYPFELTFRAHNVSGWPQIVLTLTDRDFLGRDQICGYGTVHVPTQPGTHTRYINLFKPVSSSLIASVLGWIYGKNAEYISPSELLSKNEGRDVTRVQSGGTVKVVFHVTMKNMEDFGIFPFKA